MLFIIITCLKFCRKSKRCGVRRPFNNDLFYPLVFFFFLSFFSHSAVSNSFKPHKPGSPLHGISHARILECVAISSSRVSSQLRDQTCISCIGRHIFLPLSHWELLRILLDIWKIQSLLNYKEQLEKYMKVFFKASTKIKIYNSLERSEMLKLFKFQLILNTL